MVLTAVVVGCDSSGCGFIGCDISGIGVLTTSISVVIAVVVVVLTSFSITTTSSSPFVALVVIVGRGLVMVATEVTTADVVGLVEEVAGVVAALPWNQDDMEDFPVFTVAAGVFWIVTPRVF